MGGRPQIDNVMSSNIIISLTSPCDDQSISDDDFLILHSQLISWKRFVQRVFKGGRRKLSRFTL